MNWHEIEVDYWRQRLCPVQECPPESKFGLTGQTGIIESIDQFVVLVMVSNRLTTRKLLPLSTAIIDQDKTSLAAVA